MFVILNMFLFYVFFFFKQKTAYEIMPSLVGSEMCIRDRDPGELYARRGWPALEDIFDHLETLLVNETEWRQLGGEPQVHPNWAPPLVIIKRGARGARLLTPLRYLDFPVELGGDLVD